MSNAGKILALAGIGVGVLVLGTAIATWGPAVVGGLVLLGALGGLAAVAVRRAGLPRLGGRLRWPPAGAGAALDLPEPVVLDALLGLDPAQFEEFARLLLAATGRYHDVRRVGGSGDAGVDLTMRDTAGRLCVAQCKRYRGTVPPAMVRDLYGVLARTQAAEAYLITTGRVSAAAQSWVADRRLHIWDGARLAREARRVLGADLGPVIGRARGISARARSVGS